MAGIKQHHVWQLLQRGFALREFGESHIWVYSKGTHARKTTTRKFGVGKRYYSDSTLDADSAITDFEGFAQEHIQNARNALNLTPLCSDVFSKIATHLQTRSQFIREEYSNLLEKVIDNLQAKLSDPNAYEKILRAWLLSNPEGNSVRLSKLGVPAELHEGLLGYISRPERFSSLFSESSRHMTEKLLVDAKSVVEKSAKEGHLTALLAPLEENKRLEELRSFSYRVYHFNEDSLILPDTCMALTLHKGAAPFLQADDALENIYIPISTRSIVIGSKSMQSPISAKSANRLLASCAYNNFIFPAQDAEIARYATRIGRNAKLVKESELQRMTSLKNLMAIKA